MDYQYKKENYEFWTQRLLKKSPKQVCTNDIGLDALEIEQILSKLTHRRSVLEIGCGNGLLYEQIKTSFDKIDYVGIDFVEELIAVCNEKKIDSRDEFKIMDMTEIKQNSFNSTFDFIISKRAIQQVTDQKLQIKVIDNLGSLLKDNGIIILVENSNTVQTKINSVRHEYGLPKITPPPHNLYFDDTLLRNHKFKHIKLLKIDPFASDFYFITRIVYARLARDFLKEEPNYDHPLQKIALSMSTRQATEGFSQIQCYVFKKNNRHN